MTENLHQLARTLRLGLWPGIFLNTILFSYLLGSNGILVFVVAIGLCLTSSFAFLLNDVLDREIDAFNQSSRLGASKVLYVLAGSLILIGMLLCAVFLERVGTRAASGAFVSVIAGVFLYSVLFDRLAYVKNITAAAIALSPVWIAGILAMDVIRPSTLAEFILLCAGLFLYLLAREIKFDEYDAAGDAIGGRLTLAHILSPSALFTFEGIVVVGGTVLLAGSVIIGQLSTVMTLFGIVLVLAMGGLNLVPLFLKDKASYYRITRLGMYLSPALGFVVFH